jgi:hypothetical protein|tara:strand:+ start:2616 stop:3749 length:1134 start_codon:yes stop_codon:yes gene_type:complete
MSHVAEVYAKDLGVQIGKPKITNHFYPVQSEKYIVFQGGTEMQCKQYYYWDIVFSLIKPHLSKNNIKIVEISNNHILNTKGVDEIISPATNRHNNYIISNSILYIGLDEIYMHVASHYDKPIVALFSNNYKENTKPLWNKESKTSLLEPDFKELKPSFATQENIVRINEIKPEKVAQKILDLLNIKEKIEFKTVYAGQTFHLPKVEIVPNFFAHSPELQDQEIILRGDLNFDEQKIYEWSTQSILTLHLKDKISDNLLHAISKRTKHIIFKLNDLDLNYNKFFKKITSYKISLIVIVDNKEIINDLREKYFDFEVVERPQTKKLDKKDNLKYISKKKFISDGKIYFSEFSSKIVDKTDLFVNNSDSQKEIEDFYIYE